MSLLLAIDDHVLSSDAFGVVCVAGAGGRTGRIMDSPRALDVLPLLQERLAELPGARDRRGGPVLFFPASPRRERAKPEDYRRLLQYLLSIPW